jgi:hypothetical protein
MVITNQDQKITFQDFDKFDRKPFADNLTKAISKFYPFYEESYVLSLNAKFGSGKTTFLKMWKEDLESQDYKVIYINAWKSDFDEDPIIHIIGSLLESIKSETGIKKTQNALKKVLGASALTTNQLLKHATGIDVAETCEKVEEDSKNLTAIGGEIFKTYSFKEEAYSSLKKNLKDYVAKLNKKPLIIFVDELDRVRPNYAIKFLEAIKHMFGIQGICFVLAVDKEQLKVATEQLYGKIDFDNYYLRFYTRESNLPTLENKNYTSYIEYLSTHYFDEKRNLGVTFPFKKTEESEIFSFVSDICKIYQFRPRQIELLFRIFSQLMAVEGTTKFLMLQYIRASIFFIALFIDNKELYNELGKYIFDIEKMHSYILNLNYEQSISTNLRYLVLMFTSFSLKTSHNGEHDMNDELVDLALKYDPGRAGMTIEQNRREMLRHLINFKQPNGLSSLDTNSGFELIYDNIENWKDFL